MKEIMQKVIRFREAKIIEWSVPVFGLRALARHIKMDAGELSAILNGKRIVKEPLARKIAKGIRELQAPVLPKRATKKK